MESRRRAPTARIRQYIRKELLIELLAAALFAAGIRLFSAPGRIVGGGVSGIATVLHYLFGTPIGTMSFLLNVPLLLLGYRKLGRGFILQTLRIVLMITIMMDAVLVAVPPYRGERLLAALFGGVLTGAGLGMVLMRGGSTGGTDILVKLIRQKYPHLSFGSIILLTDLAVVGAAALAYRDVETVMYGLILIYSASAVIDRMTSGADARKLVLVVSRGHRVISERILYELGRGVTLLDATGAYSGEPTGVLLCVVDAPQLFGLKCAVREVDPGAFMIVAQASEILGQGFKNMRTG